MDALRSIARSTFESRTFYNFPLQYDVFTCHANSGSIPMLVQSRATVDQIEAISQSDVSFLLVKVQYDTPVSHFAFHSSKTDCRRLQKMFKIDIYGLGMVAHDMKGFHYLDSSDSTGSESYYLQCIEYKFLWSYDTRSRCTRAIIFSATSFSGPQEFVEISAILKLNLGMVSHPLFLPLSGAIQVVEHLDKLLRIIYDTCRNSETTTGYRPKVKPVSAQEGLLKLADLSREMSVLITRTERAKRRIKQWKMALDTFVHIAHGQVKPSSATSLDSFPASGSRDPALEAIRVLHEKLVSMEIDFTYVGARVQNHACAIGQMMNRDDALTSIKLAETATRDSSSMKVVAIMTMAFLPGTFFAALFSMPSLDGDTQTVVQGNFWLYWAFTLPCTVLVFITWALLTQRDQILSYHTWVKGRLKGEPEN